ncbi:MAG: thioesterase family protein [Candidatus Nanopelagicales bacterium]
MKYVATIALRWSDMDALGHINNSEYLRYFEQARIEFLADASAAGVPREAGLLVARHEVDYRKPMPYRRTPVDVPTWIAKIGTTSFTFVHEVQADDLVYARAKTVIVCIDDDHRPTPVPVALRTHLEKFAG